MFLIKKIDKLFEQNKIDTCIYSAGVTHDSYAKKDPENTIIANSLGVNNFLILQKRKISNLFI